jgi:hypothetical protein
MDDMDASLRANFVQNFLQISLIDLVFFIAFKDLATILDRLLKTKNQQKAKVHTIINLFSPWKRCLGSQVNLRL